MKHFAVFGNPIKQSKSPFTHQLFSQQTGIALKYSSLLAPTDAFELVATAFFAGGGAGANVTHPFKGDAYNMSRQLTERARRAGAVNTLKMQENGELLGDNTDGVGLLDDLKRLSMLKPGGRILLLGAGGAVRGVLQPLLHTGCTIVIANRTLERAQQLAARFADLGPMDVKSFSALDNECFDLIINATSTGLKGDVPAIPASIITAGTCCYDMTYTSEGKTPFLQWAKQQGAEHIADGVGMLVAQAAHSFALWNGVLPEVEPVLLQVRKMMGTAA
ncbi:MAG: shikimate dehydrogenase [Enterobacteriaceae bacterium]